MVWEEIWGVDKSQIVQGLVNHGQETASYPLSNDKKPAGLRVTESRKVEFWDISEAWNLSKWVDGGVTHWDITVYFSSV